MLMINGADELFNSQGAVVYSQPIESTQSTPRKDRIIILTTNPSLFIVATQDAFLDSITVTTYGGTRDDVFVLSPVNNDTIQSLWPTSIILSALNDADVLQVDDPENFILTLDDEHCRDIQQAWDLSDWD